MSEAPIELTVRRETLRKQVLEGFVMPPVGADRAATSASYAECSDKTKQQVLIGHVQFITCCVPLFLAGWNDGTLGPLLPRMQSVYNVNFTTVSLLFVLSCLGFISGALINVPLSDRLGFGKVIVLGSTFQLVAFALMAPALPFSALAVSYAINSVGIAMQDAQANGFVASFDTNAETKMGILHAVYGAGALCSPLVSTQFAQMKHWSFFYLTSLGLAIINTLVLVYIFRFENQDECMRQAGQVITERSTPDQSINDKGTFRQILGNKIVQLLAVYILVYVGIEVTIGGWIVTFIIHERHGGPSSGYISAGFFGGLMIGRVALLWVNEKVGERRVIFLYALTSIGLELVIWLVPSLIGNAIAVSFVGVLLGPMYPLAMNHAGRVLPRWILPGSIGWIAGFGQAGSALMPFMTGAISNKYGIKSLQPLCAFIFAKLTVTYPRYKTGSNDGGVNHHVGHRPRSPPH